MLFGDFDGQDSVRRSIEIVIDGTVVAFHQRRVQVTSWMPVCIQDPEAVTKAAELIIDCRMNVPQGLHGKFNNTQERYLQDLPSAMSSGMDRSTALFTLVSDCIYEKRDSSVSSFPRLPAPAEIRWSSFKS